MFYDISEEEQEHGNLLDGINKREQSMEVGLEYFGILKTYDFRVKLLHDGLSKHDGTIGSIEVARPIFTRYVMFVPGLSFTYLDSNTTNYYFGVAPDEVTSFRSVYEANSSWLATARLYLERPMSDNWSIVASTSYSYVSDEIHNSPFVENRKNTYNLSVGVLWAF